MITLFLAFAQPPLWIDFLGVLLVCAGLVWIFRSADWPPALHPAVQEGAVG